MIDKLKEYFKNTPRDKVLEDCNKSKDFDNVGPTVKQFLNNNSIMKLSNLDYQVFLNQKLPIGIIDSENGEVIAQTVRGLNLFIQLEVSRNISKTFADATEFILYSNDGCNTVYCNVRYENTVICQFMAYSFLQANTESIVNDLHEAIEPVLRFVILHFEQKEIEEAEIQYLNDIKNGDCPN